MTSKRDLLVKRAQYLRVLRDFFHERGFLEVTTPLLVPNPGLEPNIHYFETEFNPIMGRGGRRKFYLPTSPEYHLKKALSWGVDQVFEISHAFRNGELAAEHRPEFAMLEWYRQGGTYRDIAEDVEKLLEKLWKNFHAAPLPPIEHHRVRELFQARAGWDVEQAQKENTPAFEEKFHRVFLEKVEPTLTRDRIYFLWDFPAPLRALSKLKDPYTCQRFEVYWGSVELGNAFDELIDPAELRAVCEADRAKRREIHGDTPALDEEFLAAHATLNPQMGGIAMGVDRIFQWLMSARTLDEVMLFEGIS